MNNSNRTEQNAGNVSIMVAGIFTSAFGLLGMLGWIFQLPLLASFSANYIPMAPSTALLFILIGIALSLRNTMPQNSKTYFVAYSIGVLVAATGLLIFIFSIFKIHVAVEHLGFAIPDTLFNFNIGHMSSVTAVSFVVCALTFLLTFPKSVVHSKRAWIALVLASTIVLIWFFFFFAYLLVTPLMYGGVIIPPSLPTSLAFLSLAIGLFMSAGLQIWQYNRIKDVATTRVSYILLFIFILLASSILSGGYIAYRSYEKSFRKGIEQQLSAVSELKVSQLVQWRKERLGDANVIYKNDIFSDLVKRYLKNTSDADAQKRIQTWMGQIAESNAYDNISLHDIAGTELISLPKIKVHAPGFFSAEILKSRTVAFQDFYRNENDKKIYLTIVVPILDANGDKKSLGVIAMRIDPKQYLYPLIEKWPTPSRTSETLIIRKDGSDALFLNNLRFLKDAALNLRVPITDESIPAVKAVLGQTGIIEGLDYRRMSVIADVRSVPDSPWYLVARMDIEEVYEPLNERLWLMIILLGALIFGAGGGVGFVWRHERVKFYKAQHTIAKALRMSEALLEDIIDNTTSLIYVVDREGRFLLVNRALTTLLSVSRETLIGQTRDVVMPQDVAEQHRKNDLDVMDSGRASIFDEQIREQDGMHTYLSVKYPLFNSEGKIYGIGGMSTDVTERKRAEEKIREKDIQFQKLSANVPDLIFQFTRRPDGTYYVPIASEGIKNIFGCSPKDVVDDFTPIGRVLYPDDVARVISDIEYSAKHLSFFTCEFRVQIPGKPIQWIYSRSTPEKLADGSITWYGFNADITERKLTEEKLKRSENEFRLLAESIPQIVWISDPNGFNIYFNQQWVDYTGMTLEESCRDGWNKPLHPDDRKMAWDAWGNATKYLTKYSIECRLRRADGEYRWWLIHGVPVFDAAGIIQKWFATCTDIHEIKLTEEKIRNTETELRNALDVSNQSRLTLLSLLEDQRQMEDAIRLHSSRLENLHGIDQAILLALDSPEAVVQSAIEYIRDILQCQRVSVGIYDLEQKEIQIFAATVDGKTIVQAGQVLTEKLYGDIGRLRQSQLEIVEDMSKVEFPSAINKMLQAEGIQSSINIALISSLKTYGVLNIGWKMPKTITQDEIEISKEVASQITIAIEKATLLKETNRYAAELEQRVVERTSQLELSNKELEAFSYSVSHDLRAPLRGIDGWSLALQEEYNALLGEEGQSYINTIRSETQRMGKLIDDILNLSRLSRTEMHVETVDLSDLASSIAGRLQKIYPKRNAEFIIQNGLKAYCDITLMEVALSNLFDNAFKFTGQTPQARIEFSETEIGSKRTFYIRDNGAGFDMAYADKLFKTFQRLHKASDFTGTGVGLAIVQRIVHRHGGRVWAESQINKGATFYFTIKENI